MAELEWLMGWTGQSTEELLALDGSFRKDSIVLAFEQAIQMKAEDKLSQAERTILATEALEREVNNGGYWQFFENCPEYAPSILDALRAIGCPEAALLSAKAIDSLRLRGPLSAGAVRATMGRQDKRRDSELAACDQQYFDMVGDLAPQLLQYIRAHKEEVQLG